MAPTRDHDNHSSGKPIIIGFADWLSNKNIDGMVWGELRIENATKYLVDVIVKIEFVGETRMNGPILVTAQNAARCASKT